MAGSNFRHKRFDENIRVTAAAEYLSGNATLTEVATKYGTTTQSIHNWAHKYLKDTANNGALVEYKEPIEVRTNPDSEMLYLVTIRVKGKHLTKILNHMDFEFIGAERAP